MSSIYKKYKVHFWLGVIVIQQLFLLFCYDGTGDDGDSIVHYMHNKYAFEYPYTFLHLWAKPVLVALSSSFAQLGMTGMKLFNSICAISAGYFAYRMAKELDVEHAELCIPVLMFMPRYLHHSLSALTEPLFSCLAVLSILLIARNRNLLAAIIVAWLPFARPEGIFFLAAFGVYFAISTKRWKFIPILGSGYVLLSLTGYLFFEQELLWLFNKNPYPALEEKYNVFGDWLRFILGLKELYGIPIYYLFWLGFAVTTFIILKNLTRFNTQLIRMIMLGAIIVVIASHTIFHRYSIFASFGLLRTVMTVSPLSAIVAVTGISTILALFNKAVRLKSLAKVLIMCMIVGYTYSGHIYTFKFPDDFKLQSLQLLSIDVAHYVQDNYPDTKKKYHYYPYLNITFQQDPFDWKTYARLTKLCIPEEGVPDNTIIIWDDWYAKNDGKVTKEQLDNYEHIEHVKSFHTKDKYGETRSFEIYKSKIWN